MSINVTKRALLISSLCAAVLAGCQTATTPDMQIPSKTGDIEPPDFASASAAAQTLAKNSPYTGEWTWRYRSENIQLTQVQARGSNVSGTVLVRRTDRQGGGIDRMSFSDAKVTKSSGVWQFNFRGKLADDLSPGEYFFKMTGPGFLEGYSTAPSPNSKHFLKSNSKNTK